MFDTELFLISHYAVIAQHPTQHINNINLLVRPIIGTVENAFNDVLQITQFN